MKLRQLFENEVPKITDPYEAYQYAKDQGKRIPELEPVIMKDPNWARWYAINVIKGRWPEAEPIIMTIPIFAYTYAREVIKDRWLEAEPIIMNTHSVAKEYLKTFPEARPSNKQIPKITSPLKAFQYAIKLGGTRVPELEPVILKNPYVSFMYVRRIINDRWPEAESVIMKDPHQAYMYAKEIIKGRWPEAEPYIATDKHMSYYYIKYVIKKKQPDEIESSLLKHPLLANAYMSVFPKARISSKDVPLVLGKYAIMDVPNTVTDAQVKQILSLLSLQEFDNSNYQKQIGMRMYYEPLIKKEIEQNKLIKINLRNISDSEKTKFVKDTIEPKWIGWNSDFK